MILWIREAPGFARLLFLGIAAVAVAVVGLYWSWPVAWGTAALYGTVLAFAMRWAILMPVTGARVIFPTALLLEATWRCGLLTALLAVLIAFLVRKLPLFQGDYNWPWRHLALSLASLSGAYLVALVAAGGSTSFHAGSWLEPATFSLVPSFWVVSAVVWSWAGPIGYGRGRTANLILRLQQTWWVPVLFLAILVATDLTYRIYSPLEALVPLLLLLVQYQIGPVVTTVHQDRAVAMLAKAAPARSAAQSLATHRVLQMANTLARACGLSTAERRLIGYAAILQDAVASDEQAPPAWLDRPPEGPVLEALQAHLDRTLRFLALDGVLEEVAALIRFRYASYDGSGYPGVAGDAIPIGSQVLAAANAVQVLTAGTYGRPPMPARAAITLVQQKAARRFHPSVLLALSSLDIPFQQGGASASELPALVSQLRGLLSRPGDSSSMAVLLRNLWLRLIGRLRLTPSLPPEVEAIASMAAILASNVDAERIIQITVEAVGRLFGAKVALALPNGPPGSLGMTVKALHGFADDRFSGRSTTAVGGPLTRALINQEPVYLADVQEMGSSMADDLARTEGLRSALLVPLVHSGRVTGLLMVFITEHYWFVPGEVGLVQLIAGQAAVALENARLIDEAETRLQHISAMKSFTDTLLDNLTSAILVINPEGRLILANASARTRFGGTSPLELGQPLRADLAEAFQTTRALAGGTGPETDLAWEGSILEVQSAPLFDRTGAMLGAICMAREVTAVRQMEDQVRRVERLAAVGQLAAGAAHEIRNPLTSIRGFIQLLQVRSANANVEFFDIVLKEIDRIDDIIRDLLLLARPPEPHLVELSLQEVVDQLLLLLEPELTRQGIRVERQSEEGIDRIHGDPKLLRQLGHNLIRNAIKAMPFGGTLQVVLRTGEPGEILLEVLDTGVGIPQENLTRLFGPFFTTKENGTGLGLAICHGVVQAHGGRIDVQSSPGAGTTFRIHLPAAVSSNR